MDYKKLNPEASAKARAEFASQLPTWATNLQQQFCTLEGTPIANGANRIVIGDYGAFVEFETSAMIRSNLKTKEGQEFRDKNPAYSSRVKYSWLTAKDTSDIKIYYQKRTVTYADYQVGKIYIAPDELLVLDLDCCNVCQNRMVQIDANDWQCTKCD